MEQATQAGLYMPAMMVAFTMPDIMGALASGNGSATAPKYRAWLSEYVGYPPDAAEAIRPAG